MWYGAGENSKKVSNLWAHEWALDFEISLQRHVRLALIANWTGFRVNCGKQRTRW